MTPKEERWIFHFIIILILFQCSSSAISHDTVLTNSEITYDVRTLKGEEPNSPLWQIRNLSGSQGQLKKSENDEEEKIVKTKESTKSGNNDNTKYYIGGGVLGAVLIVVIITICCWCCSRSSKQKRPMEEPKEHTQSLSLSQQVIQMPHSQIEEDTLPRSELLEQPIIIPQMMTEPQITQVEVYPRDSDYDTLDRQNRNEIIPTREPQLILERPDLVDNSPPHSRYDSAERARYSKRQERQTHNRSPTSETENYEVHRTYSADHKGNKPAQKASEYPSPYSSTPIEASRNSPDMKLEKTPSSSDSEVIPAIKTKLNTIEETMSTIEKDLDKLKHLKKDLEHEMVNELERTSSLDNRNNIPKQRKQPRKTNSFQVHNRAPGIDKRKKIPSSRDGYFVEPYPKAVTHEFKKALNKKHDMEHNAHESHVNKHHHSDSTERKRSTDSEVSEDSAPKHKKNKRKENDPADQTEMALGTPPEIENISIPDPDYLTQSKEDISSEYSKEENLMDRRPQVPPKPLIKRREFKGPYGIEDLDDMNNPLTLALRMKGRRPVLEQGD